MSPPFLLDRRTNERPAAPRRFARVAFEEMPAEIEQLLDDYLNAWEEKDEAAIRAATTEDFVINEYIYQALDASRRVGDEPPVGAQSRDAGLDPPLALVVEDDRRLGIVHDAVVGDDAVRNVGIRGADLSRRLHTRRHPRSIDHHRAGYPRLGCCGRLG
jgi:hypothetical protein